MTANPAIQTLLLKHCTALFAQQLEFTAMLHAVARAALWLALIALALQAFFALVALAQAAIDPPAPPAANPSVKGFAPAQSTVELVKALPGLIDSIGKAPAAVVLIALGLLIAWVPQGTAPEACPLVKPAPAPTATPAPASTPDAAITPAPQPQARGS